MLKASGKRSEFAFVDELGRTLTVLKEGSASFAVDGRMYTITNQGFLSPTFELWRDGDLLASAKQAAFVNRYAVDCGGKTWKLKATGLTGRKFALFDGGARIGAILPKWYNPYRETIIDMPGGIPVAVQIFLTWIAARHWDQSST